MLYVYVFTIFAMMQIPALHICYFNPNKNHANLLRTQNKKRFYKKIYSLYIDWTIIIFQVKYRYT